MPFINNLNSALSLMEKISFIALYLVYHTLSYLECKSFEEAESILEYGSDRNYCMPICIIELPSKKMKCLNEILGQNECQLWADEFFAEHYCIKIKNLQDEQ